MSLRKFIFLSAIIFNSNVHTLTDNHAQKYKNIITVNSDLFLYLLLLSPIYLENPEHHLDNWHKACLISATCFAIALIIKSYYVVQQNLAEIDLIKAKMDLNKSQMALRKLKTDLNNVIKVDNIIIENQTSLSK